MIIQHNLLAQNGNRNLKKTGRVLGVAARHLSSGYRIGIAADDAAGLSISEKMRAQIRGLNEAANNCMEGQSLIATADAGMAEIDSILHRIRELCVQSANDTNTKDDREAIAKEVAQLEDEVDRIGNETEYNTIKVLQGVQPRMRTNVTYTRDANLEIILGVRNGTSFGTTTTPTLLTNGIDLSATTTITQTTPSGGTTTIQRPNNYFIAVNFAQIDNHNGAYSWSDLHKTGFTFICTQGCGQEFSFYFDNTKTGITDLTPTSVIARGGKNNNKVFSVGTRNYTNGKDFMTDILQYVSHLEGASNNNHVGHANMLGTDSSGTTLYVYGSGRSGNVQLGKPVFTQVPIKDDLIDKPLFLQVGANSNQLMEIQLPHIDKAALKMNRIRLADGESSSKSLDYVDDMLNYVNLQRASMGAYYNRLEHAIDNAKNASENIQNAESLIRDADMADEIVEYSKYSIVMQAGQAMLAQANVQKNGILALLQG